MVFMLLLSTCTGRTDWWIDDGVRPRDGVLLVSWQRPTSNTDGSLAVDVVGYRIAYRLADQSNDEAVVDTANSDAPLAPEYLLEGLQPAKAYQISISAYDSDDYESVRSVSIDGIARLSSDSVQGAVTEIDQLPITINLPGTYRLARDMTLASGSAITIAVDDVELDGNGRSLTYAENGPGIGVLIVAEPHRIDIHSLRLVKGSYQPVAGERVHAIQRHGPFAGLRIFECSIEMRNGGASNNALGYPISLSSMAGEPALAEIFNNDIVVRDSPNAIGIRIDGGSFKGSIHHNSVEIVNGSGGTAITTATEMSGAFLYRNDITIGAESFLTTGIILWGTRGLVMHANTFLLYGDAARGLQLANGANNNLITGNIFTISPRRARSDIAYGMLVRDGSFDNAIYGNTIDGTDSAPAYGMLLGGDLGMGEAYRQYVHGNVIISDDIAINIAGGFDDAQFWSNQTTALGTGLALQLRGGAETINERIRFDGDSFNGGVRFFDDSGGVSTASITFCGTNLTNADIQEGAGIHDFSLQTDGCLRPLADIPSPPSAVTAR